MWGCVVGGVSAERKFRSGGSSSRLSSPSPPASPRSSLTPRGRCTPRCAVRRDASRCRPPVRVTRYARATNTNCLSQINISRGKKTRLGTYNCRTSAITVSSLCLFRSLAAASPRRGGDTGDSSPLPPPDRRHVRLGFTR